MPRMSDEEVYLDYCRIMEQPPVEDRGTREFLIRWVGRIRQDEPRINCGAHLANYCNICDDDDDMDSFYGPDYFKEGA